MENKNLEFSDEEIEELLRKTLELITFYKEKSLTIPFALKGNLGEFLAYKLIKRRFPGKNVKFVGGARPGFDILLEGKKIQVKTKIVEREKYVYYEASPTIKKKIIEERLCDYIFLVQLYLDEKMRKIEKYSLYIFDQGDFSKFSNKGCWSGNSKGDYTIRNIIDFSENAPKKTREMIDFYNTEEYKRLFENSKESWLKIKFDKGSI